MIFHQKEYQVNRYEDIVCVRCPLRSNTCPDR
jgi:hypothetical protein